MASFRLSSLASVILFTLAAGLPNPERELEIDERFIAHKIVGGDEVVKHSWPFLAMLSTGGDDVFHSIRCGSAVIDATHILTAAHCIDGLSDYSKANFRVTVGEHDITKEEGFEQRRKVVKFTMHPQYDSQTVENDVAVLTLAEPLDLSTDKVKPIQLNTDAACPAAGAICKVAGWGTLQSGGDVPDTPQEVEVPVVSNEECLNAYPGEIFSTSVCAGLEEGGKDSCQGDSGGPFICQCGGQWVHVGIVSWGHGCAVAGKPGVYARTSSYISYIQSVIGDGGNGGGGNGDGDGGDGGDNGGCNDSGAGTTPSAMRRSLRDEDFD